MCLYYWKNGYLVFTVLAVCLPGRMQRCAEPLLYSINDIVQKLCDEYFALATVQYVLSRIRFAFIGHSMGMSIFELFRGIVLYNGYVNVQFILLVYT